MSLKHEMLQQISKDLKITQYKDEEQNDYLNRVLYSAIAVWMVYSLLDHSFDENYNRIGVSKSYLTRKISKIISEYVQIFPQFRIYLDGLSETEFAVKLREIYEKAGYIVPVKFDEFVIGAPTKIAKVNDSLYLIRNDYKCTGPKAIGLGLFLKKSNDYDNICNIDELFYLSKLNAFDWTSNYIKNLKWIEASKLGENTLFFDPTQNKSFSNCWRDQFPERCKITLYKTNDWDYGFAKKYMNEIIGLKVPEFLIGKNGNTSEKLFDNDVRRFMYGLKAMYNNNAKAIVYKKIDHFELRLLNAILSRELTALQFFGWRKKGILNEYQYTIPYEMFDSVIYLLEKLSITVEVKNNE